MGLGLRKDNILVTDSKGVLTRERLGSLDEQKAAYARETSAHTLADAVEGADIFLGVSMGGVLKPEMVESMASRPLILALANPEPEIRPELAKEVRPDAIIATGRSDYPNQVNNVLCFPFIFRGALDVGATTINEEMKLAAVRAIAELAQAEQSDVVSAAYGTQDLRFGPDFLIPRPFDPRLILTVAPAVAQAAIDSGVATRPFADIETYRRSLQGFVYTSGTVMQPVFAAAAEAGSKRIAYAEGEDDRVLRAAQVVVDERLATPILVGRPDVIAQKIKTLGLRLQLGRDAQVANFDDEAFLEVATDAYYQLRKRQGLSRDVAAAEMRRNGDAHSRHAGALRPSGRDAVRHLRRLCPHLRYVEDVIGLQGGRPQFRGHEPAAAARHTVFICDPYIHLDPTAEEIAEMTCSRRPNCAASGRRRGPRCSRTPASAPPMTLRRARCATR